MLYNVERPKRWDDMIGQEAVVKSLKKQSVTGKFFQVYVLAGQFGSGKTTAARIIAMAANCKHKDAEGNPCCECEDCRAIIDGVSMDVVEMDAASNTGVDHIRDLKETVNYRPVSLSKKIYIIDEVHMLSTGAFNALLKVLEEPPADVIFILCTTELKKIPATVRSRAACYQFSQIVRKDMVPYLKYISVKHGYHVEDAALELIARNSDGAMRNALSLLEQATQLGDVTREAVAEIIGVSDPVYLFSLLECLLVHDIANAIRIVNELLSSGKNAYLMVNDLLQLSSDCVLAINAGIDAVEASESEKDNIRELIGNVNDLTAYCRLAGGLIDMRGELRISPDKTTLVCGIMKMNAPKGQETVDYLNPVSNDRELSGLKQQIDSMQKEIGLLKEQIRNASVSTVEVTEEIPVTPTAECTENFVPASETVVEETCCTEDNPVDNMQQETGENSISVQPKIEVEQEVANSLESNEPFAFGALGAFLDLFGDGGSNTNETASDDASCNFTVASAPADTELEESKMEESADTVSDTVESKETERSLEDLEEVEKYIEELCATQRVIAEMMNTAFEKSVEEGKIVFSTSHEPVYQLMKAREKALEPDNGFPFQYRLLK